MRLAFVYVGIVLTSTLANIPLLAAGALSTETTTSGVRVFKNAADALKYNATSNDSFYLEAGSYNSVENSLKRQFHLSREIHYPVIVEVRGRRHLVLVGPIHSAKAVKSLSHIVFGSSEVKKQVVEPISRVEYSAVYPGAAHLAVHQKQPVASITKVRHPTPHEPGVNLKNNHGFRYQKAALKPNLNIIKSEAKALNFKEPSSSGPFYLQAGAFNGVNNARNQQRQLSRQLHYPVRVERQGNFHLVLIGPVHSAADVRALGADVFASSSVHERVVAPLVVPSRATAPSYGPAPEDVYVPTRYPAPSVDKDAPLMRESGLDHVDILAGGGIASLRAGDSDIGVTATESDQLVQTNDNNWSNPAAQLGVGYVHAFPGTQQYAEHVQWFPFIEPEINAYYQGSQSIKGNIAGSNLTYTMPYHSVRLMFDAALTIATLKHFSVYGKGGIGNAWNTIGYNDPRLSLSAQTCSQFAWEAGGGLLYNFNNRVGLSLEYLYTSLGWLNTSSVGDTGTISAPVIVPGQFNLSSQAGLIGLHIAI